MYEPSFARAILSKYLEFALALFDTQVFVTLGNIFQCPESLNDNFNSVYTNGSSTILFYTTKVTLYLSEYLIIRYMILGNVTEKG